MKAQRVASVRRYVFDCLRVGGKGCSRSLAGVGRPGGAISITIVYRTERGNDAEQAGAYEGGAPDTRPEQCAAQWHADLVGEDQPGTAAFVAVGVIFKDGQQPVGQGDSAASSVVLGIQLERCMAR